MLPGAVFTFMLAQEVGHESSGSTNLTAQKPSVCPQRAWDRGEEDVPQETGISPAANGERKSYCSNCKQTVSTRTGATIQRKTELRARTVSRNREPLEKDF